MTTMPNHASADLDREGRSQLHYAAGTGDIGLVLELLQAGYDVNLADRNGWTPLHFAAQAQSAPVIRALLGEGAVVDAPDKFGNTPLNRATFNSRGKGEAIKALRAVHADPLMKNNHGVSPFSLARSIGNYDVAQFFEDVVDPSP